MGKGAGKGAQNPAMMALRGPDGQVAHAPMLEKTMPPPGPDTYIFCCGPPPMIKSAIAKLEALGHDPSHVLCF